MKPVALLQILLVWLSLGLVAAAPSSAQSGGTTVQDSATARITDARSVVESSKTRLEVLRGRSESVRYDDDVLVQLQSTLKDLAESMDVIGRDLTPRLEAIKRREEALGAPPGENGPPEPDSLVQERQSLAIEKSQINADIGNALALGSEAGALSQSVSDFRRRLFRQTLLGRVEISLDGLRQADAAIAQEWGQIVQKLSNWTWFTWRYKRTQFVAAMLLAIGLGLIFVYGERRLAARVLWHDMSDQNPSAFDRHTFAFWTTLLPVAGLGVFGLVGMFLLSNFGVLRADIAELLLQLFLFVLIVFLVSRLANAVLSPRRPRWRLVPVSDHGAWLLWWLIVAMAFVNAGDYLAGNVGAVMGAPIILTVAQSFVATIVIGILLIVASFIRPLSGDDGVPERWPVAIGYPLRVLGALLVVLSLSGYIGLSRFAASQIVDLGTLLVAVYLGFLTARAISEPESFRESALGEFLTNRFGLSRVWVEQFALMVGLLIYLFVLLCGFPVMLLIWGFQPVEIQHWFRNSLSSFTIGSVTISLTGILLGLVLFAIGFFVTRWFQKWLDENVMQRSRMERGLRDSIRTAIGYAGVALAAMIGASIAGLNLSNLALVAGALSVGIGFGLQNIVNNFVSGLILLAERPFKIGDWVVTSSTQGFVKHISVRATEIETFQRQTVMVPNSELINSPVSNWTHRDRQGRVDIAVGVSYDADPRRVIELLEEIGFSNDLVLRDPAPGIIFMGFGASSLDFELRVYLRDVLSGLSAGTDLRLKIFERFKAEGIEIPFPQRDLNIKFPSQEDETQAAEMPVVRKLKTRPPSQDGPVNPDGD